MKDPYDNLFPNIQEGEKNSIFNQKLFGYPFTSVKLNQGVLKELQNPLNVLDSNKKNY